MKTLRGLYIFAKILLLRGLDDLREVRHIILMTGEGLPRGENKLEGERRGGRRWEDESYEHWSR